ncbi:P2Y purinoceptor 11-like [Myxocyprinus asiaticus]|uniref:P2Y purinoceptor 11-like n=1 Tax=Myxocyprinus asiaticus TaxID=70543 RepID=UPI0022223142|nr:P2Y purinoceptor 11-like [Myxocyprinus asiaticus]
MNNSSFCDSTFQTHLLPPMYSIEMCVALAGNVFALWLLATRERQNWHTGVVFSCNLAISDVLYILTLPLLIIYYAKTKHWVFGCIACKIERFLFNCNLYVSIFFIMCISVNRYLAIIHPFFTRSYVHPKQAKIISMLTWLIVIIASSPVLKFAGTSQNQQNNTHCVSNYDEKLESAHFKYKIFVMVVGCMVPLVVTFTSYLGVIWTVLKNKNITTLEKRKVALMVALVCILYAISFVPYHALQTYQVYLRMIKIKKCWVHDSYQVSKGLATLNMCTHPLLYMAVFDSIRTACCGRNSDDKP